MLKNLLMILFAVLLATGTAFADTPAAPVAVNGWGPAAVASVGAFYFNGNYTLLSGGFSAGAAYTWTQNKNVNSAGLYLGPQSQQLNGVTTTSINAMIYVDLYKTSAGPIGLGLGTRMWESGSGFKAPSGATSFLALGYHFL